MRVGLQEITVQRDAAKDFRGTMKRISDTGYKYVEWLNMKADFDPGLGLGIPAEEVKRVFDEYGVKLTGALVAHSQKEKRVDFFFDTDALKRVVDWHAAFGCETIGIPIEFFPSKDYLLRRCDAYNRLGQLCKDAGLQLTYHNHYHEFLCFEGKEIYDWILENTDPDLLKMELDVYWALRALVDPAKLIRKLGKQGRIKLLHTKDFPFHRCDNLNIIKKLDPDRPITAEEFASHTDPEDFIEVGQGIIKIQDIVDAGNEYNVPYIFVEQDYTKLSEFESIKVTLDGMRTIRGIEWD
jgi:sugar phosphate isomerase/epimerase